jgi:sugar phosphate permease
LNDTIASVLAFLAHPRESLRGVYRGWWIVLISYYTQLITAGAGGWVFGVLVVSTQEDFGWEQKTVVGVLLVDRWISGGLAAVLGPYVDKNGSRLLMTASAALAGLGLIAVSFAQNVWMFYAAWALYGIAQPGVGLLGPRVSISNWFIRKRPKAFVLFTLGSATAGIIAAPIAAYIDVTYSWRMVWLLLGFMSLTVAPLAWITIRRRPEDLGLLPDGDSPAPTTNADGSARPARAAAPESPWTVREALHTRAFWLITGGFLLISAPSMTIFINISGFAQSHGFTKEAGASVVAVYGFGVLFGRPTWGVLLSRIGLRRTMVIYAAAYAVSIAFFAMQTSLLGIRAMVFLLGISVSAGQLMNAQALPDYFGRNIVGRLTGFAQVANVTVAGSSPLMTAAVFDATGGYTPAFLVVSVACVVAATAFFFARPPIHPSQRGGTLHDISEPALKPAGA